MCTFRAGVNFIRVECAANADLALLFGRRIGESAIRLDTGFHLRAPSSPLKSK
jgi:hypothetical protein